MIRHHTLTTIITVIVGLMFLVAGCSSSNSETTSDYSYQGSWVRQAAYMDGELTDEIPVKLLLTRTTFNIAGTCSVTGKMDVEDNAMQMTIQSSTCEDLSQGMEYTTIFELSEDGNVITTFTNVKDTEVKKIYHRKTG